MSLKAYFDEKYQNRENSYNIFSVLHKETDETYLHSRFLAFLLDSRATHKLGDTFFKLFLKNVLEIDLKFNFYEIKTEYHFIDILIHDDHNAIIIENKIYAGDSNHKKDMEEDNNPNSIDERYEGQLARYYHTISTGLDKTKKPIDLKQRNVIQIAYLTLAGHPPSDLSTKKLPIQPKKISYLEHISKWLDLCATIAADTNTKLKDDILQYNQLILKLTSEVPAALKNKKIIANSINEAFDLEDKELYFTKKVNSIFNHVKWHTIADFFNLLKDKLSNIDNCEVISVPTIEEITKVAHASGKSNQKLILKFRLNDQDLQIVNDSQGFTLVNIYEQSWRPFSAELSLLKFNNFNNKQTFYTIDNQYAEEEIIKQLIQSALNNHKHLKKIN